MASDDFLATVVAGFLDAVQPLTDALDSEAELRGLLGELGWELEDGPDMGAIATAFAELSHAVDEFARHVAAGDDVAVLAQDVQAVITSLISAGAGAGSGLPGPLDQPAFWQALPDDAIEYLLFSYLERHHVFLFGALAFAGVLRRDPRESEPTSGRVAFVRKSVDFARLPTLLSEPQDLPSITYGWGGEFDHEAFMWALGALLAGLGAPAGRYRGAPRLLDVYYDADNAHRGAVEQLTASPLQLSAGEADVGAYVKPTLLVMPVPPSGDRAAAPEGILLVPFVTGGAGATLELTPGVALTIAGSFSADVIRLAVRPSGLEVATADGAAQFEASARVDVRREPGVVVAGDAGSTRLELWKAHLALEAKGTPAAPELTIEAALDQMRLVIDFGEGDGFLQKVIGSDPVEVDLAPGLAWSSGSGVRFLGQPSLELELPLNLSIAGIVTIERLHLRAAGGEDGRAVLEVGLTGGLTLGPIAAAVEEVGLLVAARATDSADPGNLGPLDLEFGFKPPTAVGLAINASVVRGGGFVYFDTVRGQYAGVLQLELANTISLKAIGLISTRLPDGSPGFSLFVLITAEGFSPIQLGLGFTLNGVGGLLGINRSVNIEPLRGGLKSGTLDSVLFPADPVRNAPAILNTLDTVFPARRDHYVLGPMAIIGWGSPTILTLKLALLLEFPDPTRLILLGRLAALLPAGEEPLVRLQMDAIGVLDFDRGELSLDASLFDSRIAQFVLTGDMALRIGWGAEPQFLLSVGGLNPRSPAPPGLRPLERLAISLAESDNPRLRLEAYFAITSNTLQFGARFELFAAAAGFSLEGHLGFDALVQFVPFGFVIDMSASVALRFGGSVILSVAVELTLSGPSPWRAVGSASFTFLLISASVAFDLQIGEGEPPPAPELIEVRPLLAAALADPRNWASQLPQDAPPLVSLREAENGGARVHPLAVLVVRERVVPLNRRITRYGSASLRTPQTFTLDFTDSTGAGLPFHTATVTDAFARSQYEDLRDDEKLTLPSFEAMDSGLRLGLDELAFDADGVVDVAEGYETWLWDPALDVNPQRLDAEPGLDARLPDPRSLAVLAGLRP